MLIAAALAEGDSVLTNVLESDDTTRTREILGALGAGFERKGENIFVVRGLGGTIAGPEQGEPLDVNVGESGTTCRLILALLAAGKGRFRIHGHGRMHKRPVAELADVLQSLGVHISYEEAQGCPPLVISTAGLDAAALPKSAGGMVAIGCDQTSQYLSGLLMAAPLSPGGLTILLGGERVVSWPYVSLTLDVMERFGIGFTVEKHTDGGWQAADWHALGTAHPGELRFRVAPGRYRAGTHAVENDWSGSSYFLAAGAVGPKPVRVRGVNRQSLQGDAAIQDLLVRMGAKLEWNGDSVTAYPSALSGIEADMGDCPDLVPTLAAVAAHAAGPSRIYGAAHLKIKESNRIEAPALELRKVGCEVTMTDDGMIIVPPAHGPSAPADGGIFSSHDDHRIAMSLALLGLPGLREGNKGFTVRLDNPGCVSKSFPYYWMRWEQLL